MNVASCGKNDSTKELHFPEYKVKRGWLAAINGPKAMIEAKNEKSSDEADSGGYYNPMSRRNPHQISKMAAKDAGMDVDR